MGGSDADPLIFRTLKWEGRTVQKGGSDPPNPRANHTPWLQATMSEGLAQGPYVAARGGFEPATFRT